MILIERFQADIQVSGLPESGGYIHLKPSWIARKVAS